MEKLFLADRFVQLVQKFEQNIQDQDESGTAHCTLHVCHFNVTSCDGMCYDELLQMRTFCDAYHRVKYAPTPHLPQ